MSGSNKNLISGGIDYNSASIKPAAFPRNWLLDRFEKKQIELQTSFKNSK
jgi:hypothetical protein